MKKNRPPPPPPDPAGNGAFAHAWSRKKLAEQTIWHDLSTVGALGFTLVGSTFLGLLVGYNLDRWLKTSPWFTILFLLGGIVAGFTNIFLSVAHARSARCSEKDAPPVDTKIKNGRKP